MSLNSRLTLPQFYFYPKKSIPCFKNNALYFYGMKAANSKQTFFHNRKCAYILFALTWSLILGSCESPGKSDNEIEKKVIHDDSSSATKNGEHVLNFYKQLYGSIGKHNISMVLHANENKLSGNYFYFRVGVQLRLIGEISADNTYQLFEIAPGGDTTGVFKGLLKNEEGLSGTWTNVKTKQIFPFVFSERDTSAYLKFTKEEYQRRNCADADSVKALKLDSLVNWYDTACTVRDIQLLRFLLPDKKLADKIYTTLLHEVAGMLGTEASVDSMLNVVNGDERCFDDGVSVYVTTYTPLILSVSISHTE